MHEGHYRAEIKIPVDILSTLATESIGNMVVFSGKLPRSWRSIWMRS